jgi:hypothetical protein
MEVVDMASQIFLRSLCKQSCSQRYSWILIRIVREGIGEATWLGCKLHGQSVQVADKLFHMILGVQWLKMHYASEAWLGEIMTKSGVFLWDNEAVWFHC